MKNDDNIKFTDLGYLTNIKYIYHISDVHIQLYKRHNEYLEQFDKLYNYLKQEKEKYNIPQSKTNEIPLICCVTGDILHSKTDLSPECIQICYQFFNNISKIMPLVIIPGNHDVNMNNKTRLDSLTPIIGDLPDVKPVKYLKDTGLYFMGNIIFSHASIFDYKVINPEYIDKEIKLKFLDYGKQSGKIKKILLYHGRVDGGELFNGTTSEGEKSKEDGVITPNSFDGYDMCLLGDIHKHQFLKDNIAYAGSFIQQNMGEDVNNHGIIKWDVDNNNGQFIPFECDYAFVTLRIKDKKAEHYCIDESGGGNHKPDCTLKKNLRLRILYENTPIPFINNYITILKYNHNIIEYTFQNDETINDNNTTKSLDEKKSIDITLAETQNKYIEEYLKNNTDATQKEIEMIKLLNISQNKLLIDQSQEKIHQIGNFKLIDMEFHNLFSYGSNNYIKLTN